ncbi:hypothetical protein PAMC26577_16655 [Caballeronia sordidicola]|uniref:Uncharacterized protein n=1 Tax=Caballeronia sordidicola TaxID=196367 RepID=A0A242MSD9_CABSO|nr:hypothetical protein PAMC26577_16655 [Caballeronia sordidicola]
MAQYFRIQKRRTDTLQLRAGAVKLKQQLVPGKIDIVLVSNALKHCDDRWLPIY